jgi:hypothetical protein
LFIVENLETYEVEEFLADVGYVIEDEKCTR